MPRGRAVARLPEQVQGLPQSTEIWEASLRRQRLWITPKNQPPYRPYGLMIVSDADIVLAAQIADAPLTTDEIGQHLLQTMLRPSAAKAGPARRPTQVLLDNAEQVAALTPLLESAGVGCAYRATLPLIDAVEHDMVTHLHGREPIPGLLSLPGVTVPFVGHLYELAATFHQLAPWTWLSDRHPMAIRYPIDAPPRFAVVMGSGGEVFGLAVYDSLADLQRLVYTGMDPKQLMRRKSWFALFYNAIQAMSFDDLDAMERWGWPIASGEEPYPIFTRTTREGGAGLPSAADLLWMEGALDVVTRYVRRHKRGGRRGDQLADLTLPVEPVSGPAEARLWLPVLRW